MHRPAARAALAAMLLALPAAPLPAAAPKGETVFDVTHVLEVPAAAARGGRVRAWFWMPEDRPGQTVEDFRVTAAPEGWRVTRDPGYGRGWIHAEGTAAADAPFRIATTFVLRRKALSGLADAAKATPLTAEHRATFAKELRTDELHMEVNDEIRRRADALCGDEKNPVVQARKIFDFVIGASEHYGKVGPDPKGLCLGDAMECLKGAGDCCTDQHALFIAMARARGIPCRLVFGSRLQPKNEGKEHDPGYRCWPYFFAPGLGWVPLDVSSADHAGEAGADWFGGLDENRVEWAEGRDFDLEPRSAVKPDLVIRGWVEVDGKPLAVASKDAPGFKRTVKFTRR